MAIDIRATVTCSLGTLISASISDDYVQGTGLIKCKGSCELSGIVTPNIGDEVTFSYTQNGVTTQVPRKLRVMSSFADPFRRTTKVELGCKLTYLSDFQEPVDWTPFDDIANNEFVVDDAKVVTVPISAKSIMNECLSQLGITASNNPLTSSFSVERFDLSPGYVQVLSDLLVSESYCGYLDKNEVLQIASLDQDGGTGPVLTAADIIELGPIGVGQLPGEAVIVNYSTLQLQAPSGGQVDWEVDETIELLQPVTITYNGDFSGSRTFTGRQITRTETTYETLSLATAVSTGSWFYWQSTDQYKDVVAQRVETTTSPSAYIEGKRITELLAYGIAYSTIDVVSAKTVETTTYFRTSGDPERTERLQYEDRRVVYSRLSTPLVFSSNDYVSPSGLVLVAKDVTTYERSGDFYKTFRVSYQWEGLTQYGSTRLAEAGATFTTAAEVVALVENSLPNLICTGQSVSTTQQGVTTYQGRPSSADLTNSTYASGGDPSNGWRTTSTAELALALGSATAQRRIELTVPYPPDDIFTKIGSPPVYSYEISDAEQKAKRFGRVQNKLLLGNRSGMNLQVAAKKMPNAPFAPLVVEANGLSALYRTNGTSWQMDANGILASTDALFWGAVGGTGSFWFPVAPGITTLPTTPAVVDGQMTVGTTVPVWNETLAVVGRTSTKLAVTSLSYPLTLLTEAAVTTRTKLVANKITKVDVPLSTLAVAAPTPAVALGASVQVPVSTVALAAVAPAVSVSTVVAVPLTSIAVAAVAPTQAGADDTVISVPLSTITLSALVPEGVGANLETFYNSWRLQVYGTDAWVYPDWWAD